MTKLENNFICDKEVFKIRANISTKQNFKRPIKPLVILPQLFPSGSPWLRELCVWTRRYYVILYPFSCPFSGCALCYVLSAPERLCLGKWGPFTAKLHWWSKGLLSPALGATCQLLCNKLDSLGGDLGRNSKVQRPCWCHRGITPGMAMDKEYFWLSHAHCDRGKSLTLSGPGFSHFYEELRDSGRLVRVDLPPGRLYCAEDPLWLRLALSNSSHLPGSPASRIMCRLCPWESFHCPVPGSPRRITKILCLLHAARESSVWATSSILGETFLLRQEVNYGSSFAWCLKTVGYWAR